MARSMRSRTAFCSHGFLIPGKPEPWLSAGIKASRFCLRCWEQHSAIFSGTGYERITTEDPCTYGFLDLITCAIKFRGNYRDQDEFESLESELRLKLLAARAAITKAIGESPSTVAGYVKTILNHRIEDIQDTATFKNDAAWEPLNEETLDECDASDGVDYQRLDPLRKSQGTITRKQENAELVRAAIEEQGHRIDALTAMTQREQSEAVAEAHREVLAAIDTLPPDEKTVMRLRFVTEKGLREKPCPRSDMARELRAAGCKWSEWDLRQLEQQAVLKIRSNVRLPTLFKLRD